MQKHCPIQCQLLLLILVQVFTGKAECWSLEEVKESASLIFFGPLWKFGEYCGDSRDSLSVIKDDGDIIRFHNGSSLENLRALNASEVANGIAKLTYDNIKSRTTTSLLCSISSWGYVDEDVFRLSNSPQDNELECSVKLKEMQNALQNRERGDEEEQYCYLAESVKQYDPYTSEYIKNDRTTVLDSLIQISSFGRVPSGNIFNQFLWPGNYQECAKYKSMRYCLGAYKSKNWLENDTNSNSMIAIRIGLCLPRSCNSKTAKKTQNFKIVKTLLESNLLDELKYNELVDIHCPPTEDSPFMSPFRDTLSVALILLAVTWLILLLSVNFQTLRGSIDTSILRNLNLQANWYEFVKDDHVVPELAGLNFIKVVGQIWIMGTHTFLHLFAHGHDRQNMSSQFQKSIFNALISQGQDIVPVFFIISGFLVGYKNLRKKYNFRRLILYRYIRLLPMYLLVYAYIKKFGHLIGSGPLWDYGVSLQSENRQCMLESWFVPVLMLASFIPPFSHCILTGWHIANDFQTYIFLPVILYAYQKSRIKGTIVCVATNLFSIAYLMRIYYTFDKFSFSHLASEQYIYGEVSVGGRLAEAYVHPLGRLGGFCGGIILADLILEQKTTSSETKSQKELLLNHQNSKSTEILGIDSRLFNRVAGISGVFLVGILILLTNASPSQISFLPYPKISAIPMLRAGIELGWFLIIYNILITQTESSHEAEYNEITLTNSTTNVKSPQNGIIRSKIWNILVKLNYCLILTHFTVIRYIIQTQPDLLSFSQAYLIQTVILAISLAYIIALILHLTVEVPLVALVNWLIDTPMLKRAEPENYRVRKSSAFFEELTMMSELVESDESENL